MYSYCEVKIPKSGKKLKTIGELTFFFRTAHRLLFVYETETKVLVLCCPASKGEEFVENFIANNIDRVRKFSGSESQENQKQSDTD